MHSLAPTFRSCFQCVVRPWIGSSTALARRPYSSSEGLPAETSTAKDVEESDDLDPSLMEEEGRETPKSYRQFMEKIGYQYRFARTQNWLGQNVPFPMNPSFRPPPPISDFQKEIMWQLHYRDSREHSVRRLAKRFNLSIKRVDSILRLKGMEKDWIKQNKELQTGFLQGMERLLNAQTHSALPRMIEFLDGVKNNAADQLEVLPERLDVHKADMLEQEERRDATPYRYERLYWESIPEDANEPILPNILRHVKKQADVRAVLEQRRKKERFMKRVPNSKLLRQPKSRIILRIRQNRPATKFVDVGAEFVDVKALTKRAKVAARKASMRAREDAKN